MRHKRVLYSFFDAGLFLANQQPIYEPDKIAFHVPEGITAKTVRESEIGQRRLVFCDWYDRYEIGALALPSRIYQIRMPIPDSNNKITIEQETLLLPEESITSFVVLELAYLFLMETSQKPYRLPGAFRCFETANGKRLLLSQENDRLSIGVDLLDRPGNCIWMVGVRTL